MLQQTYIEVRWIALDADSQVLALYINSQVFGPDASRYVNVYIDLSQCLIPLIDHATVVCVSMSLTWRKSFSAHGLSQRPVITRGARGASNVQKRTCVDLAYSTFEDAFSIPFQPSLTHTAARSYGTEATSLCLADLVNRHVVQQ